MLGGPETPPDGSAADGPAVPEDGLGMLLDGEGEAVRDGSGWSEGAAGDSDAGGLGEGLDGTALGTGETLGPGDGGSVCPSASTVRLSSTLHTKRSS